MKHIFIIMEKNSEGDIDVLFAVKTKAEVKAALEALRKNGLIGSAYFFKRVEVR